ncbi:MAG: phage holin family protein [Gemmatimonadales bacterium]
MQQHSAELFGAPDPADRPLKELVSGLGKDMGLLIRQEIALAKAEISEKTTQVAKGAMNIGIGAFLAYAGVLALVATLVLVLVAIGVTAWLAAAIITIVLLIAGYTAIQGGRQQLASGKPTLQKTKSNAKETVHRLKEQLQ